MLLPEGQVVISYSVMMPAMLCVIPQSKPFSIINYYSVNDNHHKEFRNMKNLEVTAEYKGHPVIAGKYSEYCYNERHLANNLELMENMTQRHNKIYSFRMDLRMPEGVELNKSPKQIASSFMSAFSKKLTRQKIDSEYIAKMEQEDSDNPHFHIQMFVDGNKIKDHGKLVTEGEKLLATQLGLPNENNGLLDYKKQGSKNSEGTESAPKKKNGIMLRRNSDKFKNQFDKCFKQASYLSKKKPSDKVDSKERKVFYSKFRNGKSRNSK